MHNTNLIFDKIKLNRAETVYKGQKYLIPICVMIETISWCFNFAPTSIRTRIQSTSSLVEAKKVAISF